MAEEIYQLKITLRGIEPPIWRRMLVPAAANLAMLHAIIQEAMGWEDCHLHEFRVGAERYEPAGPEAQGKDTRRARLKELGLKEGQAFEYVYDFGDDWEHELALERIVPAELAGTYPACTDGARACPPEDSGGPHGYMYLLEARMDPGNPEHAEVLDWLDLEFDSEAFDLKETNDVLRVAFGRGAV